ncbi:pyridoxamine 5'-phosphate oxidase family protein [Actinophytocola sp.]|uniref:pyridoxamine 5'-phosphate oxidase family protein n=1 Tax=Actinophytocola sp. TaxID=1872138 RepID=UPI002D7E1C0B|nr:pyridoxamine 5'-phosphate oxidase family protein [Actinophytocola sp.]HET9140794.1 pyridoxamine 5'-phosphate oxidase family protein [Actinophytocola sp.]
MTVTPLSPTPRSTVHRGKNRAVTDRADLHAVLDAGLICHLAFLCDGEPVVIPTGYGRDGDTLYVHGSTGARSLREAAAGSAVCVNVTLLDGVVYGRSVFHNSVNYRSAVIHGRATQITEAAAKLHGLRVLTEHLAPGSWDYARPPNDKELAKTALLALDLGEAAVKIRTGPPVDEDDDVAADAVWAGVLPLHRMWGEPRSCPTVAGRHAVPEHVKSRNQA